MKNVIVIGAGRFGRYTIRKLHEMGHQVLVIDRNEDRIDKILPFAANAQIGDGTNQEFMETLGVSDYDLCIVAIGDDFLASLETTFLLKELGAPKVVSRATTGSQEKFLLRNGADAVIYPERQLGSWTAIRYASDNISDYIELTDGYSVFDVKVPAEWDGKRIGELDIRQKYQINILALKNHKLEMNINTNTVLHSGQHMLVLGTYENIQRIFAL